MRRKILLVDDESMVLQLVKFMLHEMYEVDGESSAEAGLEALQARGPYAAVVADLGLPGMDGATFLKATSELAPSTAKLAMTGGSDAYDEAGTCQEFKCFPKPFTAESLRAAVSNAIAEVTEKADGYSDLRGRDWRTIRAGAEASVINGAHR